MKISLILIVSLFAACNNLPEQGFTNKAEAKNKMVNGLKEGKWIEYLARIKGVDTSTIDTGKAMYFKLTVYKAGKPYGIERKYYKEGILMEETPYTDFEINGVKKKYYKNGELRSIFPYSMGILNGMVKGFYIGGKVGFETTYINGILNGVSKSYYISGYIATECPYTDGRINGVEKVYYDNGKVKSETIYTDGLAGVSKNHDENGNEVK